MTDQQRGACSNVLYVERRNAKSIKIFLETYGVLHKDFRMTGVDTTTLELDNDEVDLSQSPNMYIAVPIVSNMSVLSEVNENDAYKSMVVASGRQFCPYSTAVLGNPASQTDKAGPTRVQKALFEALMLLQTDKEAPNQDDEILERITKLSISTCPKKLEVLGDDKTLVLPQRAFSFQNEEFFSLIQSCTESKNNKDDPLDFAMIEIWKGLASIHGSPRVVRRGDIDPNSPIRESGHVLLWPVIDDDIPHCDGPKSPGWITVTEQGIQQSFDLTLVMFCRGNITEKIRFGNELVQDNDMVLDMYAGIGYYTLPALIHGKARHVVACEWNPHACFALKFNLQQNGVAAKATVHEGDCRQVARQHNLVNMFDRVSLGLLPSSEGGWRTAVKALRHGTGGWLHVHGNVPDAELAKWQQWLCSCLLSLVQEDSTNQSREHWIVLCIHVERVKSFAPKIHHYVADVWIGPPRADVTADTGKHKAGVIRDGYFVPCPKILESPSCALSSLGVMNQSWMMDIE